MPYALETMRRRAANTACETARSARRAGCDDSYAMIFLKSSTTVS